MFLIDEGTSHSLACCFLNDRKILQNIFVKVKNRLTFCCYIVLYMNAIF